MLGFVLQVPMSKVEFTIVTNRKSVSAVHPTSNHVIAQL